MNKISKGIIASASLLFLASSVSIYAYNDEASNEATKSAELKLEQLKKELDLKKQQDKENLEMKKEQAKEEVRAKKEEAKENMRVGTEQMKTNIRNAKEMHKEKLESLKEEAKERSKEAKEKIKENREKALELAKEKKEKAKEKIDKIKDARKREGADKIARQLEHINNVWTDHFSNVLDRLDEAVQKMKSRIEKAEANGKDVFAAKQAVLDAESKIKAAREAVISQAQKTYVADSSAVSSTSDENLVKDLRNQFKSLRNKLFSDLMLLRDGLMRDARISVNNALKLLSQVKNVDDEPAESSSEKQ